ncbi:MAG: pyridoxal phosphate-dependent aminotransferase, partial [Rectinemataceae bacterium]|nr:pyridoxal phosphate-dependent aminotransferase [Rectinemataceae bacterium]
MVFSRRIDFSASRNGLNLELGERLRQGLAFFDLSQSNPTKTGFQQPAGELAAALSAEDNSLYSPDPKGLASARSAIAAHLALSGKMVDQDRLLLCASTSEAYSYLFKLLCDPGDSILVPKPGYPLFDHLASLESVQAIGYRLEYNHPDGWNIDLSSVQRLLESTDGDKVKAIVLINPNNPTGSYIHEGELRAIQEICRRHSLVIISDEVFHGYELEPRGGRVSLLAQDRFQNPRPVLTFVLDGLSKRLCLPQVKLGWIAVSGPEDEVAMAMEALELISDTFLSAGTPIMNGVGRLLAHEEETRSKVKTRMATNLALYRKLLEYEGSPHRIL